MLAQAFRRIFASRATSLQLHGATRKFPTRPAISFTRSVASNIDAAERWGRQRSRALRIQNLPLEATEEDLQGLFSQYGQVKQIEIRPAYESANFKRATVAFTNPDDTDTVVDLHNQNFLRLHNRDLFIRYGSFTKLNEPNPTIFVGGMSPGTTEEQLRELISKYGEIKAIRMTQRGFAHVQCVSVQDAKAVVDAHEAYALRDHSGQLLRVNYDRPRDPWHKLCISGYKGSVEDLRVLFQKLGCAHEVKDITPYHSDPAKPIVHSDGEQYTPQKERPPLYFIFCKNIPSAQRVRDLILDSPDVRDFHVDFGSRPKNPKWKS